MYKFNISDGKQKDTGYGYGYDYILYLSRSEVENKQEKGFIYFLIFNLCDWYHLNLTLDQLRRIKVIVDEGKVMKPILFNTEMAVLERGVKS